MKRMEACKRTKKALALFKQWWHKMRMEHKNVYELGLSVMSHMCTSVLLALLRENAYGCIWKARMVCIRLLLVSHAYS